MSKPITVDRIVVASFALLGAALPVPVAAISAQEPPQVEPGARVRVTAADNAIRNRVGTLRVLNADSIVLEDGLMLPLASVTRLEVSRRTANVTPGVVVGFLAGAAIGAVWGASATRGIEEGATAITLLAAGIGSVVGAGIGGIVGLGIRTDRWEEVPSHRLRVNPTPQRSVRLALGLSVRF